MLFDLFSYFITSYFLSKRVILDIVNSIASHVPGTATEIAYLPK
jgi:hypothetical protein